jgi:hypothetical protein
LPFSAAFAALNKSILLLIQLSGYLWRLLVDSRDIYQPGNIDLGSKEAKVEVFHHIIW